jgi:hypothetical protein
MPAKAERRRRDAQPGALADPQACRNYAAAARERFDALLREEGRVPR